MNDERLVLENLRRHVDRLSGLIGPRHPGKPAALRAAEELIRTELLQSGYAVRNKDRALGLIR